VRRARLAKDAPDRRDRPPGPATGYGYIEAGEEAARVDGYPVLAVRSFKEKPSAATAAAFIAKGNYFWNAGTFVWRVPTLLEAFRLYLPGHYETLMRIDADLAGAARAEDYARFEGIPIDMGIADENVRRPRTSSGTTSAPGSRWVNARTRRNVVAYHAGSTHNCIVFAATTVVATLRIDDLIVVHTRRDIICPKGRAEEVRQIVFLSSSGSRRFLDQDGRGRGEEDRRLSASTTETDQDRRLDAARTVREAPDRRGASGHRGDRGARRNGRVGVVIGLPTWTARPPTWSGRCACSPSRSRLPAGFPCSAATSG
jgi:hypothetical protein